jgi:hypothetical protein
VTALGNDDPLNPTAGDTAGRYTLSLIFGEPESVNPALAASQDVLDFGPVEVGSVSAMTLELTNPGGTRLDIAAFELAGDTAFSISERLAMPRYLSPGESIGLLVGVQAETVGPISETLHIHSTDPGQPDYEILLSADAVDSPPEVLAGEVRPALVASCSAVTELWFQFSEHVALGDGALQLHNVATAEDILVPPEALSYSPFAHAAAWDLAELCLDSGHYVATLFAAEIADSTGNALVADHEFPFIVPAPGDVNWDGEVNGLDVAPFVELLISGVYLASADLNYDGGVNGLDVQPFVSAVIAGGAGAESTEFGLAQQVDGSRARIDRWQPPARQTAGPFAARHVARRPHRDPAARRSLPDDLLAGATDQANHRWQRAVDCALAETGEWIA